ncbi:MAG: hypothetical protein ACI92S_003286, partial [Planctomycetaceae bacterium]
HQILTLACPYSQVLADRQSTLLRNLQLVRWQLLN